MKLIALLPLVLFAACSATQEVRDARPEAAADVLESRPEVRYYVIADT